MQTLKKEYSATETNSRSCYKSLFNYGAGSHGDGKIYPPTPASVQPLMFAAMTPHKIPINPKYITQSCNDWSCSGYTSFKDMNGKCGTATKEGFQPQFQAQFKPGFNDITRWS